MRGSFGSVMVSESLLPRPLLRLAHADDGHRLLALGSRFIEGEFGARSVSQFILHGL